MCEFECHEYQLSSEEPKSCLPVCKWLFYSVLEKLNNKSWTSEDKFVSIWKVTWVNMFDPTLLLYKKNELLRMFLGPEMVQKVNAPVARPDDRNWMPRICMVAERINAQNALWLLSTSMCTYSNSNKNNKNFKDFIAKTEKFYGKCADNKYI